MRSALFVFFGFAPSHISCLVTSHHQPSSKNYDQIQVINSLFFSAAQTAPPPPHPACSLIIVFLERLLFRHFGRFNSDFFFLRLPNFMVVGQYQSTAISYGGDGRILPFFPTLPFQVGCPSPDFFLALLPIPSAFPFPPQISSILDPPHSGLLQIWAFTSFQEEVIPRPFPLRRMLKVSFIF